MINVGDDFGKDIFPKLLPHGRLFGYISNDLNFDVGSMDRYEQICLMAKNKMI